MTTHLPDIPSSVLRNRLEIIQADSDEACRYRRELKRRVGERDEKITLREAARIMEIPERVLLRYADLRIIRPADHYLGKPRFWRSEIRRWRAWTDREGPPNA